MNIRKILKPKPIPNQQTSSELSHHKPDPFLFLELPLPIQLMVIEHLDARDFRASRVNKHFHTLFHTNTLSLQRYWKKVFTTHLGEFPRNINIQTSHQLAKPFNELENKRYLKITKETKPLLRLMKENQVSTLLKTEMSFNQLIERDSNGDCLLSLASEKRLKLLLDYFYQIITKHYTHRHHTHLLDVTKRDTHGYTILHYAIICLQPIEHLLLLTEQGCNPLINTHLGLSSLQLAARVGHVNGARWLLELGANPNATNTRHVTALGFAVKFNHASMVTLLLDADADINQPTSAEGYTPLILAASLPNKEIASLLIKRGADINKASPIGITPLHLAAMTGQLANLSLLLSQKATINAVTTKSGQTPLTMAIFNGHIDCAHELITHGADSTITCHVDKQRFLASAKTKLVPAQYRRAQEYLSKYGYNKAIPLTAYDLVMMLHPGRQDLLYRLTPIAPKL